MGGANICDPVAHCFADGFLQGGLSSADGDDFRAQELHPRDVESLPFHIDRAHVNDAFAAKPRGHGGSSDTMLSRAGLGDDTVLAHPLREQDLAERIVDFMRAGMEQVFALQVNFRAAEFLGESFGKIKWCGTAREIA